MTLLFQYIFKRVCNVTILLSLILIGIVWLTQSLRFIEVIVNHNISLKNYFSLVVCLIPDLLSTVLPICLLIASLHVYHRLNTDHELAIMHSLGLSPFQIARPFLSWGVIIMLVIYGLNLYLSPFSFQKFRQQEYQIKTQFSLAWLREGNFNTVKGVTLYIRKYNPPNRLEGIFIYHPQRQKSLKSPNGAPPYTLIAESGTIEKTNEGLFFILKKGLRQEFDLTQGKKSEFCFDILKYHLSPDFHNFEMRAPKVYEKSLKELLNPIENTPLQVIRKMSVEAHQRLLLPWLAIADALLASVFMLSKGLNRRQSRYRIVFVSFFALLLHVSLMTLLNFSIYYPTALLIAYGMVGLTLGILLCGLTIPKGLEGLTRIVRGKDNTKRKGI